MTWTAIAASTATYTAVSPASKSYATPSIAQAPWGTLSSVTSSADEGVDFVIQMSANGSMLMSTDRPFSMVSHSYAEGTP